MVTLRKRDTRMAVVLTKQMGAVEEMYPQGALPDVLPQMTVGQPENLPAIAQNQTAVSDKLRKKERFKEATVRRGMFSSATKTRELIPLNDLTALDKEELQALMHESIAEIEEAFELIKRVAAEGERRAELDDRYSDTYYSDVCDFHEDIVKKIIAYNKRYRRKHRKWI